MPTAAPSPAFYAGMPLGWNVQANGNEALTGNKPDPSFSGDLTASGLLAESFGPNTVSSGWIPAAGVPIVSAISLLTENTVSNLWYDITTAGSGMTANNCWAFLLNSSGLLIGQSADQHTLWATAGIGGSAGAGTALIAASTGSLSNLPAGIYYGGVVWTGGTGPTFASAGADPELSNINTSVAAANFLSASLTPSVTTSASLVAASPFVLTSATLVSKRLWMGVN